MEPDDYINTDQAVRQPDGAATAGIVAIGVIAVTALTALVVLVVTTPEIVSKQPVLLSGLSAIALLLATGLVALLRQGHQTHLALNSRLSELLEVTRRAAAAEAALAQHMANNELEAQRAREAALALVVAADKAAAVVADAAATAAKVVLETAAASREKRNREHNDHDD